MKSALHELIKQTVFSLQEQDKLPALQSIQFQIERARNKQHGDYACNIALLLAKQIGKPPREIAEVIAKHIQKPEGIADISIAGPGFINFTLAQDAYRLILEEIFTKADKYGYLTVGANQPVHVEFVSANPTGPLHVGHGRSAAFGGALADLLNVAGYQVHREYYVNDAGRQMHILATSIWLRYLELCDLPITFPSNAYKGDYVFNLAKDLVADHQQKFVVQADDLFTNIPADEPDGGDKEQHIDALIDRAKQLLGTENYDIIFTYGKDIILDGIKYDLHSFGVDYQEWFSEDKLLKHGFIEQGVQQLKKTGHCYERTGALWFRSTDFGDDKDRVLIRENGQHTYFAADVAYHWNKFKRGFRQIINVLGADHHGYVPRLRAVIKALGIDPDSFDVPIVQFATLYRGKEKVQMSTRSGSFVTLRQLIDDVGKDAARFFYIMRKPEQHMDFDLELAKEQSTNNPVYYIQYAHARICSVFRQLSDKKMQWHKEQGLANFAKLQEPHEIDLLRSISSYIEIIETSARNHEPHMLAHYLRELADYFHSYYNAHQFLIADEDLRNARLTLIAAAKQVIANGLQILGVSVPEEM